MLCFINKITLKNNILSTYYVTLLLNDKSITDVSVILLVSKKMFFMFLLYCTMEVRYVLVINVKWYIVAINTTSKEPVCPRVELIFKIIIILLIIFLGFIKSKPC